jgi:hypothetical protein
MNLLRRSFLKISSMLGFGKPKSSRMSPQEAAITREVLANLHNDLVFQNPKYTVSRNRND